MKKVKFNGRCYKNIKELCDYLDLDYQKVWRRIHSGYSVEEAVKPMCGMAGNRKKVVYQGKEYSSIKELCEDLNLPYSIIGNRLRDGYTVEQAVSKPSRYATVFYKGKEYLRKQLCEEHNIPVDTFRSRVANGLSVEEALQKEFINTCVICGKTFTSKLPNRKYCCKTCKGRGSHGKGAYKTYNRVCTVCGKPFTTDKGYHTECCSDHCRRQLSRIERKNRYKHLKAIGKFDNSVTLENVFNKFNGICVCCGKVLSFDSDIYSDDYPSIDHITPISKGGTHTWDNVQLMCRKCNIQKGDKN